jgi:hypothetical protein
VWENARLNDHFANFENEMAVINTLRGSIRSMIDAHPAKELLNGALSYLDEYENRAKSGSITFRMIEAVKESFESTDEVKRRTEENANIGGFNSYYCIDMV